jgi:hypothetical protein
MLNSSLSQTRIQNNIVESRIRNNLITELLMILIKNIKIKTELLMITNS